MDGKARCFVTGATGHLGSALVRLLADAGHEVAILIRPGSDPWRLAGVLERIASYRGSLADASGWRESLIAFQPDIVFHLAWEGITREERNSTSQLTQNVNNTLRLLETIREAGAKVFVGAGSQAEYGSCSHRICESQPAMPSTAYGVAKYSLSLLSESFCKLAGIRCVWLRVFSVYGPMDHPRHLLPSLILKLLAQKPVALTAGEQIWDYFYVDDAARGIYAAAITPGLSGIYNLASGEAVRLRSVIEAVRDQIDPSLPLGFGELPYESDTVMHLEGAIDRIRSATSWAPQISLQQGLERTIAWYRETRA